MIFIVNSKGDFVDQESPLRADRLGYELWTAAALALLAGAPRAIPGKVRSGFPSGIARKQTTLERISDSEKS
ncbi:MULTISPECIES: hypothetical protein [unclassified Mesorhizobium]|uniref:hypothetical protein n=1 Tax=unclassified Mesorhizobium TaxID=325217 RepID=UPI000F74D1A5|nr:MULTISPECIES: hypothetical protein [unclassified Mesorhizobium]TGT57070.1 hypothetical protein EN813_039880 [Mesorhizobium sp. M00.F.Ca.ET.170.01.1.1]AZO10749.1 hypothetical protein EJ074_17600 [Mesorhizobium sp. M3A.F.Ca.ET.080.04.2.1]RWB70608.1 MAG: hypothetical protein EOQ49_17490 [Mesorhizobium sp.]RWB92493.1 MAG: hypothetical protein EOQ52_03035 [Mesorhizobium sp.]RWE23305.1 MAG: hypothetical protein EOS41_21645 [Mesorhizobium sp.]